MCMNISSDGAVCIASSMTSEHALAGYYVPTGQLMWYRDDLKHVMFLVDMFRRDGHVVASLIDGPTYVLDYRTGRTLDTIKGVRRISFSPFEQASISYARGQVKLHTPHCDIKHSASEFTAVSWAPGRVVFYNANSAVRCLSTETGEVMWQLSEFENESLAEIGYSEKNRLFIVSRGPRIPRSSRQLRIHSRTSLLCYLHPDNGRVVASHAIPQAVGHRKFILRASRLVMGDGRVFDTSNPKTVKPMYRLYGFPM